MCSYLLLLKLSMIFFRCLIDVLHKIGGLPKTVKTDNMTAIVSLRNSSRKKHPSILQFENDLGTKISLCEPRSPETKGKVEVSNKFMDWLKPYDGEVKDVDDLIRIINIINKQCNDQINDRTRIPPIKLFQKEKELLSPLPSKILLDTYIKNIDTRGATNTSCAIQRVKILRTSKVYCQKGTINT